MQNDRETQERGKKGVSNTALLLGAAGLFLFILGVKRKYRLDEEREIDAPDPAALKPGAGRSGPAKASGNRARDQLSPRR
jgi:hypothetical protein